MTPPRLQDFLVQQRDRIIERTRAKVAGRLIPIATEAELENGIPLFLTQIVGMLRTPGEMGSEAIGDSAARHGDDLQRIGLTVGQVVQDYGGLCQAITEIAVEDDVAISSGDFQTLNACLDHAIASAVSEFGRQREQSVTDDGLRQIGSLAHELRNALHGAIMGFDAIRDGTVGLGGSTAAIVHRSLLRMSALIEGALDEVRAKAPCKAPVSLAALIEELVATAEVDAQRLGLRFTVGTVEPRLTINASANIILAAIENLLQNAFKFTRRHGTVSLQTFATADRVRIEIEDECGGLPAGKVEDLFRAFGQRGADRSGVGLGLTISREGIAASGGTIDVRDLPGKGCVFAIELPLES